MVELSRCYTQDLQENDIGEPTMEVTLEVCMLSTDFFITFCSEVFFVKLNVSFFGKSIKSEIMECFAD